MNMDCDLIIKRLKQFLNLKNDTEIGKYFGVSQAAVSAWRSRNRMDLQVIIDKLPDVDLNWLIYGKTVSTTEEKQPTVIIKESKADASFVAEQLAFYKQAYEKKCAELDAANDRLDKLIDTIGFVSSGIKSSVSMLNEESVNNYKGGE